MKHSAQLQSSAISRIEWDDQTHELAVQFTKGSVTTVPDVGKAAFEAFRDSESPGTHWNQNYRSRK